NSIDVWTGAGVWSGYIVFGAAGGLVGAVSPTLNYFPYNSPNNGPWTNVGAIGSNAIHTVTYWNNNIVVAGATGIQGSFDGGLWHPYNQTGTGSTILANNQTVIGANTIEDSIVYNNTVVFGGDTGRIGFVSTDGTGFTGPYAAGNTVTTNISNNTLAQQIGSNGQGVWIFLGGSGAYPVPYMISSNYGGNWGSLTIPANMSGVTGITKTVNPFFIGWSASGTVGT